jgi:hypothetical protein
MEKIEKSGLVLGLMLIIVGKGMKVELGAKIDSID